MAGGLFVGIVVVLLLLMGDDVGKTSAGGLAGKGDIPLVIPLVLIPPTLVLIPPSFLLIFPLLLDDTVVGAIGIEGGIGSKVSGVFTGRWIDIGLVVGTEFGGICGLLLKP